MAANGSCEETWSVVLQPLAKALTMVVSENGLQWSPRVAPPKTAPITMVASVWDSAGDIPAAAHAAKLAGSANGINKPIVPHDEPVVNAIELPTTKTTSGSHATGVPPASNPAMCSVVPKATNRLPSDHAKINTTSAGISEPAPCTAATAASGRRFAGKHSIAASQPATLPNTSA